MLASAGCPPGPNTPQEVAEMWQGWAGPCGVRGGPGGRAEGPGGRGRRPQAVSHGGSRSGAAPPGPAPSPEPQPPPWRARRWVLASAGCQGLAEAILYLTNRHQVLRTDTPALPAYSRGRVAWSPAGCDDARSNVCLLTCTSGQPRRQPAGTGRPVPPRGGAVLRVLLHLLGQVRYLSHVPRATQRVSHNMYQAKT